jgi:hypothetical protein
MSAKPDDMPQNFTSDNDLRSDWIPGINYWHSTSRHSCSLSDYRMAFARNTWKPHTPPSRLHMNLPYMEVIPKENKVAKPITMAAVATALIPHTKVGVSLWTPHWMKLMPSSTI